MSFFLAVDAGGTKTDYLLADEERVLGRVRTGTIKRMRTDAVTAAENLDAGLRQLAAMTGVSMQTVTRTCVGSAGETVPLVSEWLCESFAERVSGELLLLGDVEIALDAAFPGAAGVLVLAGTGSNVAGRDRAGVLTRAGGWGPVLADQGSGHRIGEQALRAIFLAMDEGKSTALLEAVLQLWGLKSVEELVSYANSNPAPDFSALTGVVVRCGGEGDQVANAVLRGQGEELAHLVCLVVRRLCTVQGDGGWLPPVAFAGSIMEKVESVRGALLNAVRREFPGIRAVDGVVDPVVGALWRARTFGHVDAAKGSSGQPSDVFYAGADQLGDPLAP